MPQKYTPEFKARALKLIEERVCAEQCSGWVACTVVGEAPGLRTAEAEEITKLGREDLELRRANEILSKASASFAAELDRPTTR